MWAPGVETKVYQYIARIAAKQLGKFDSVLGVYAKRSVASGEVVLGKSDIDLTILLAPCVDVHAEARGLKDLAARYALLKRLWPCLGDCEVGTRTELENWYRSPSYSWYWYRDRGWLRLHGEEFLRPRPSFNETEGRDSLLWWFFWAWERLPGFYRAGDVRTCCNLLLDMANAYYLYLGEFHTSKRRAEVLAQWLKDISPSRERDELRGGFQAGFRGNYRALQRWLYIESLKLGEALSLHATRTLAGKISDVELPCQVPFSFSPRRYVLVDPLNRERVEAALETLRKKPEVFVTTEGALKLYLYHRNPWEYYSLTTCGQRFALSPPPDEVLRKTVRFSLHKIVPRRAGFSIGRRADRSTTIGLRYAQCQLYIEHGIIATNAPELVQQHQRHYGTWLHPESVSREVYFLRDYPRICRVIEEMSLQTA